MIAKDIKYSVLKDQFRTTYNLVAVIAVEVFIFVVANVVIVTIELIMVNESDGSDDDGDVIV